MAPSALTANSRNSESFGDPNLHHTDRTDHGAPPSLARPPYPRKALLDISIPGVEAADDAVLVSAIVRLTNVAFIESEAGIWNKGYARTTAPDVANLLRNQQLALGYLTIEHPPADGFLNPAGQQLIACASVTRRSSTHGSLSMLALDKQYRGLGMGRDMIVFAEQHCREMGCSTMVLDLLVPTTFKHPVKTRLQEWYLRLGYEVVGLIDFSEHYPEFVALLAGPVDFRVFEKTLC